MLVDEAERLATRFDENGRKVDRAMPTTPATSSSGARSYMTHGVLWPGNTFAQTFARPSQPELISGDLRRSNKAGRRFLIWKHMSQTPEVAGSYGQLAFRRSGRNVQAQITRLR
jgi:hypothetical protein